MEIEIPDLDDVKFTRKCPNCPRYGDCDRSCDRCSGDSVVTNAVGHELLEFLRAHGVLVNRIAGDN
jgi:hypothetical protein